MSRISSSSLISLMTSLLSIIIIGPTFVVAFKLFHANWRKTRGSGKKSSFSALKNQQPNALF